MIKALIEHWFSFMLGTLKKHPEAFKKLLAEGAQKTFYVYMIALDRKVHWNECFYIAEKYYNQYFDKSCSEWVVIEAVFTGLHVGSSIPTLWGPFYCISLVTACIPGKQTCHSCASMSLPCFYLVAELRLMIRGLARWPAGLRTLP